MNVQFKLNDGRLDPELFSTKAEKIAEEVFSGQLRTNGKANKPKQLRKFYDEVLRFNGMLKSSPSEQQREGTAEHPRFIERVPEGTQFHFSLTFKVLDDGDEALFDRLLEGLKLLELDALGGSGSRGYGRIKFEFKDDSIKQKFEGIEPFKKERNNG